MLTRPKMIPSFSWGGTDGFEKYDLKKAIAAATAMYKRRGRRFDKKELQLFSQLFKMQGIWKQKKDQAALKPSTIWA